MTTTVVPTVEAATTPPRIRLDVTTNDAALTATTVLRLGADGRTLPVRTLTGDPLPLAVVEGGRAGVLYDYEAAYGTAVAYSTVEDPATRSAPVTLDAGDVWLIHPGVPSRSLRVAIRDLGDREYDVREGIHEIAGREDPIVITDGRRKSAAATAVLRTATDTARRAMLAALADVTVLLLNVPAGKAWGIGAEYWHLGRVREARPSRNPSWPARDWTFPYRVVGRPVGGTQADRTYNVAAGEVASYAEGRARGRSYLEQQAPTDTAA